MVPTPSFSACFIWDFLLFLRGSLGAVIYISDLDIGKILSLSIESSIPNIYSAGNANVYVFSVNYFLKPF